MHLWQKRYHVFFYDSLVEFNRVRLYFVLQEKQYEIASLKAQMSELLKSNRSGQTDLEAKLG